MVWSCDACTFENTNDGAKLCSICGTKRHHDERKKNCAEVVDLATDNRNLPPTKKQPKLVQSTLFPVKSHKASDMKGRKRQREKITSAKVSSLDDRGDQVSSNVPRKPKQKRLTFDALQEKAMENMKRIFSIDQLRSLQPLAIKSVLEGKCQILVMATGGGKSLCYQLPATVLKGVTVVVSPLIALMVDQVQALKSKGVQAEMISSANPASHNQWVMDRLVGRSEKQPKKSAPKAPLQPLTMVYVTPELVQSDRFRTILLGLHKRSGIAQFAIDEAHAVSEWGHDFRPAYRKLGWLRTKFPDVPCLACTATATPKVIKDIRDTLDMKEGKVPCHLASFNRPNLSYEVRYKDSLNAVKTNGAMENVIEFIKQQHKETEEQSRKCSGIIYVHKRQDTAVLAHQISKHAGIRAAAYHGGMKDGDRKQVQSEWMRGDVKVAVATVAFGMGIDLAHVRYVIHWCVAKTVEGFYQESGRAGRDGLPSKSILYYSKEDVSRISFVIRKAASPSKDSIKKRDTAARSLHALEDMMKYCTTPCCRRQFLLRHFGEEIDPTKTCHKSCDFCKRPEKVRKAIQAADVIKSVMSSVHKLRKHRTEAQEWNGDWAGELDEDEGDTRADRWRNQDLRITGAYEGSGESISQGAGKGSFTKASSVLAKYEVRRSLKIINLAVSHQLDCRKWRVKQAQLLTA